MFRSRALFAIVLACWIGEGTIMNIQSFPETISDSRNPRCLDGSLGRFYFSESPSGSSGRWVIFLPGGGTCVAFDTCSTRKTTDLGSNSNLDDTLEVSGILSSDNSVNPVFADANKVYIPYCDGFFFSGNGGAVIQSGETLYFQGRSIVQATLETLMQGTYGLSSATEVLLSGVSAGGIGTFINAGLVKSMIPSSAKFKIAPASGFFLSRNQFDGNPGRIVAAINQGSTLHSALPLLNSDCVAAGVAGRECLSPNTSWAYLSMPSFVVNSYRDAADFAEFITGSEFEENECLGDEEGQMASCTANEIAVVNTFKSYFLQDLTTNAAYGKPGNGVFIFSCYEHATSVGDKFNVYSIGGKTLNVALGSWFTSNNDSASSHRYIDCDIGTPPNAVTCNPSCLNSGTSPGPSDSDDQSDVKTEVIVGIVVAVVGFFIATGAGITFWYCRRRKLTEFNRRLSDDHELRGMEL